MNVKDTKCYLCGGQVSWMNTFSFDDCGYEGEGDVYFLTCLNCGAEYEICDAYDKDGIEESKEEQQEENK